MTASPGSASERDQNRSCWGNYLEHVSIPETYSEIRESIMQDLYTSKVDLVVT